MLYTMTITKCYSTYSIMTHGCVSTVKEYTQACQCFYATGQVTDSASHESKTMVPISTKCTHFNAFNTVPYVHK